MFSPVSEIQASPLDYPAHTKELTDSSDIESDKIVDDEFLEWDEVEGKPEILKRADPYYPELARKQGISGVVLVNVLIDTNGDVEKAEVFKSVKGLDQAALEAARKFKFTPGKKSDQPVKVKMQIPFKFHLK
jgi:protein TonB